MNQSAMDFGVRGITRQFHTTEIRRSEQLKQDINRFCSQFGIDEESFVERVRETASTTALSTQQAFEYECNQEIAKLQISRL